MRQFKADLHIHSRYSRATSKKLTLPLLAAWAMVKGIDVLATGDITHPGWREEIENTLEFDEPSGLFRLRKNISLVQELPQFAECMLSPDPKFILQGEISSIYKRGGQVRKVHNLVFFPSLEVAKKFSERLAQVGNLASDGRPILGLDCRDLLEMVLESHPDSFLIPAHIWTPWFSLFGSKSGFNSVEECFGDLAGEIFAMETGLSSDPSMNWTWSALDRYALVSNSDAHSGENLAREANLFSGEPSYRGILGGLRKDADASCRFEGTIEFFPEEGKYHTDGHRKCEVSLTPREARALGGICPVCGRPLTEGVASRVLSLADRDEPVQPEGAPGFRSLIPLAEILGEISGCGAKSQKVARQYNSLILRFGSELAVLLDVPVSELSRFSTALGEAVSRMRSGRVIRQAGYDGEYGVIRLFSEDEAAEFFQGAQLISGLTPGKKAVRDSRSASPSEFSKEHKKISEENAVQTAEGQASPGPLPDKFISVIFNQEQQEAIEAGPGPVLVLAGPGTGKTRTLVGRIEHLIRSGVSPKKILALTFTRRAALEMDKRLRLVLDELPTTDTMHALAFALWHKVLDAPVLLSEEDARRTFAEANSECEQAVLKQAWQAVSLARERRQACPDEYYDMFCAYSQHKGSWNLVDYTDLLEFWLEQIDNGLFIPPWQHVLVDEIQDLSALQLALIKSLLEKRKDELLEQKADCACEPAAPGSAWAGSADDMSPETAGQEFVFSALDGLPTASGSHGNGFFGIGDPCQAIYGFRGAFGEVEAYFKALWPHLDVRMLTANYRSGENILNSAWAVLKSGENPLLSQGGGEAENAEEAKEAEALRLAEAAPHAATATLSEVRLFEASSEKSEAVWIAGRILDLLGPTSHTLADLKNSRLEEGERPNIAEGMEISPGDIAILVRLSALAAPLAKTLEASGVPVAVPKQDAFWADERIKMILHAAGLFLGIAPDDCGELLNCPDRVIAKGPLGVAAYLNEIPPFDRLFWQSSAFKSLNRAFESYGGWAGLINWVNLQSELEVVREHAEKVQIMTMHAAKGLEFPFVFVAGLEDGLMPFAGPEFLAGRFLPGGNMNIDEERRLLYVAMTRAERGLYLTSSGQRRLFGRELRLPKSRLLNALPEELLIHSKAVKRVRRKAEQLSLF
ncbi:MAG: UvrD-helicase domain-containing protein [Desulfovibrionaceae bacterium]|nr:UvrD-helicase domain-containing protein [Desulfovibrionaceae bacterium]